MTSSARLINTQVASPKPAAAKQLAHSPAVKIAAAAKSSASVSAKQAGKTSAPSAITIANLPKKSGDSNLDAVQAGGNSWWHTANAVATLSTNKITPNVVQIDPSQSRHALTYAFLGGSESFLTSEDQNGFAALDGGQKTAVKSAFDYLSSLINVSFTLASDANSADIVLGSNQQANSAAYASYPNTIGSPTKLLLANNGDSASNNSALHLGQQGTYGWQTLIHEIGHVMGLKHPGNYDAGGGGTPGPYLPTELDTRAQSIMSYNNPVGSKLLSVQGAANARAYSYSYTLNNANPSTYGVFDIAALQYLYGANQSANPSSPVTLSNSYADYQTLWAPKGVMLDASTTSRTNIFDLREGAHSSIGLKTKADYVRELTANLMAQNYKASDASVTANAVLKTNGLLSSLYNGRNNLALAYGSRYSQIEGGAGSDTFYASSYSTTIDGKGGSNKLYLMGSAKDWIIDQAKGTAVNATTKAVISYKNIQSFAFYSASSSLMHA
jgi:serralysin